MIKDALLWYVFISIVLNVVSRLYQVFEGEHEHTQSPASNAVIAVLDAIFAVLWFIYVF